MATLQIYTDVELKRAVEKVAREEDRSVSYIIRQWIEQGLKLREQAEKQSINQAQSK